MRGLGFPLEFRSLEFPDLGWGIPLSQPEGAWSITARRKVRVSMEELVKVHLGMFSSSQ